MADVNRRYDPVSVAARRQRNVDDVLSGFPSHSAINPQRSAGEHKSW